MQPTPKQAALVATEVSQTKTVENRQTQLPSSMLDAALQYAQRGWYVFPCRERPGGMYQHKNGRLIISKEKSPYTTRCLQAATLDPVKIQSWWKEWPLALIGVNCGKSGLFVVNLDVKHGKKGVSEFFAIGGDDPGALHSRTASGGMHLVFSGSGNNTAGMFGIDTCGDGGYFIAPPSKIVEGEFPGEYTMLDDWTHIPAPIPENLPVMVGALHRPVLNPADMAPNGKKVRPYLQALSRATTDALLNGSCEGIRNDRLISLICYFAANGYTLAKLDAILFPLSPEPGNGGVTDISNRSEG
jgi:hypothetical protein